MKRNQYKACDLMDDNWLLFSFVVDVVGYIEPAGLEFLKKNINLRWTKAGQAYLTALFGSTVVLQIMQNATPGTSPRRRDSNKRPSGSRAHHSTSPASAATINSLS